MDDVEHYLASLTTVRSDPSERLSIVRSTLDILGEPQNAIPAIHIAGTSGKGSTAYYAAELLNLAGYTVGLAVSPHVNSVAERSQVNGKILTEAIYCHHFSQFVSIASSHNLILSYVEFLTVFTYWLFARLKLDYIVIEVGLGGRLDPTNSITREDTVRVITDIGLDHTEILGDTLPVITSEKAGIIHTGNVVVMHEQSREVIAAVSAKATTAHARLIIERCDQIEGSNLPAFQQRNWTLAHRAVVQRLPLDGRPNITPSAVISSREINIPGRFEHFTKDGVTIILDTAHNPQKISALTAGVASEYPSNRIICMVAFGENKSSATQENLRIIRKITHTLILTTFTSASGAGRGAISPRKIATAAKAVGFTDSHITIIDDPYIALEKAVNLARHTDRAVAVAGSFYLIDGVRALLLRNAEGSKK